MKPYSGFFGIFRQLQHFRQCGFSTVTKYFAAEKSGRNPWRQIVIPTGNFNCKQMKNLT